ncbi:MAG: cupin domain-containing protein [Alphaproteobacteria bacterium]
MSDTKIKTGGPAIEPSGLKPRIGSGYPAPYAELCMGREKRALGDAFGLKNFGVNLTRIAPGAASAQRHWHTHQDELIYMLEGELVLVTDAGEQVLKPGMTAGFPAGQPDGHMLVNRTDRVAVYLEVGDRTPGDEVEYPDIDMAARMFGEQRRFVRKDGSSF